MHKLTYNARGTYEGQAGPPVTKNRVRIILRAWGVRLLLLNQYLTRHSTLCILYIAAIYLAVTLKRVVQKPLWYDELSTLRVSGLGSFAAIWEALACGADANPPLLYVINHFLLRIIPDAALAIRLPSLVGFLCASICLYHWISRRAGTVSGLVGMLVPLVSGGYLHAYEGRPYGFSLGCSALAILLWQRATDRNSILSLFGLSLSLATAMCSHYLAGLILIPLAVGEGTRSFYKRRIETKVWAALVGPLAVNVILFPLAGSNNAYAKGVFNPTARTFIACYDHYLSSALVLACAAAFLLAMADRNSRSTLRGPGVLPWEAAVTWALLLYPAIVIGATALTTGVFQERYALPVLIGLSITLAGGGYFASARFQVTSAFLVVIFLSWFVLKTPRNDVQSWFSALRQTGWLTSRASASIDARCPLVISNGFLFMEMDYYAPAPVARHAYYLTDEFSARQYTGTDFLDAQVKQMSLLFTMRGQVEAYRSFVARHKKFVVVGPERHGMDWVLDRLLAEGFRITLTRRAPTLTWWEVSRTEGVGRLGGTG